MAGCHKLSFFSVFCFSVFLPSLLFSVMESYLWLCWIRLGVCEWVGCVLRQNCRKWWCVGEGRSEGSGVVRVFWAL